VHRGRTALGLHLNLTLGGPLGAMPGLAPTGAFPKRHMLVAQSLLGLVRSAEIAGEIERQLDAFEARVGFPPDHIDGHEHVHILSGIRQPLFEVVARRYPGVKPLLRDPSDRRTAAAVAGTPRPQRVKATVVATLALRFAAGARRYGLPTNEGFSGFSSFDVKEPYAEELRRALIDPGPRHIVMCHPGHPDAELAAVDPVVERRRMEYEALMRDGSLADRIWRPSRAPDGPPVDWSQAGNPA
jgi:predicted glycoside hydrolase/deacetylase ChbG (UPF0249 family)